jgi:ATP-dependent Lhr-like helicase
VAIRTGDTPQKERLDMRRNPPDILITTPESLYLMLTSQAREILTDVEAVHRRRDPRGRGHEARRAPRADASSADRAAERRARSAAHRPVGDAEPARGGRQVHGRPAAPREIVDAGVRKPLDLKIQVRSSRWSSRTPAVELDPLAGGEATRKSIWPAIYPQILELVKEHRSTIVFVNNRRGAERLAIRLNELAEEDIARAHHGSLAREERTVIEEMLKAGELPVPRGDLVARARHRHGRGRPRPAGRVAEVGRAGCSASAAPATASARRRRAASSRSSAPICSSARSSRS